MRKTFDSLDGPSPDVSITSGGSGLMLVISGDDLNHTDYPILVMAFDHFEPRSRKGRLYLETFTADERAAIRKLHVKAYGWYLRTGTPDFVRMKPATLALLRRAVAFFA